MRRTLTLFTLIAALAVTGCQLFPDSADGGAGKEEPLEVLGVTLAPSEDIAAATKNFPIETTTVVVWKLAFSGTAGAGHTVRTEWYWHDGTLKWSEDRKIAAGASAPVTVVGGKGYDSPGGWEPGVYTLKFFLDGAPVTEEIFRITGEAAQDKPIMLAGIDFHYAGDIVNPVEIFSRDDTDMVIWFAKFSLAKGAGGEHTVSATWLDPEGETLWTEQRAIAITEGSEVKQVAGGKGYEEPGGWAVGTYTLAIAVDGESLGEGTFEIGEKPLEDEVELADTLGLDLMRIAFYNRGDYVNQMTEFTNGETEMIVWEVSLLIQPDAPPGNHAVTARWYQPGGGEKWVQEKEFEITDEDASKRIIGGKGYTNAGNWDLGEWKVKFYLDGEYLSEQAFTVK